jgi:hypothetical protein
MTGSQKANINSWHSRLQSYLYVPYIRKCPLPASGYILHLALRNFLLSSTIKPICKMTFTRSIVIFCAFSCSFRVEPKQKLLCIQRYGEA